MIISKQLGEPMKKRTRPTFSHECRCFNQVADQLNNRPRKTLMFETPKQVLQKSVHWQVESTTALLMSDSLNS